MKKVYKHVVIGSIVLAFTSVICFYILRDTNDSLLRKELHSWIGYKFNFKDDLQLISGDVALLDRPYKIVMYIDDMGCTSCNLKLREWSDMYETIFNKMMPDKLTIVILFDGRSTEYMLMLLKSAQWEMPVFWDRDGVLNSRRPFPKQAKKRCMLLDEENKVELVGNPVYSRSVYELYIETLAKSRY